MPAPLAKPAPRKPIISFENITKRYGKVVAVDNVSLTIEEGEFFSLLGPSGCGKTSLLRMLAGFEVPTEGRILIDGQDVSQIPPNKRPVNMVFQSYAVFPHMSVADNVAYGLKVDGVPAAERTRRVEEALALVKLEGYGVRKPDQLSGGQRQRVALARALVKRPRVLLLDEPLSALDPFLRGQMRAELRRWQQSLGLTFVHVTHSQEEAMALADVVVVMNQGKIEQIGSPREIFNRPATEFVARFMGGHNILQTPAGSVAVRIDRMQLDNHFQVPSDQPTRVGQITHVEYQGAYVLLTFQPQGEDHEVMHISQSEADYMANPLQVDETARVAWHADDAHVLSATSISPTAA
jgi:ABC-type Fe3+/spermidine/putrescine transport system ATPase subunit